MKKRDALWLEIYARTIASICTSTRDEEDEIGSEDATHIAQQAMRVADAALDHLDAEEAMQSSLDEDI